VVVVDDDPLVLAVTRRLLTRAGYDVIPCDNPRIALREVIRGEPFAVVADLHMPDVDGAELLRLVRGISPKTRRILYTGESQLEEISRVVPPLVVDAIVTKAEGNPQLALTLSGLSVSGEASSVPAEARGLAMGLVAALTPNKVETLDHALRLARWARHLGGLAGLSGEVLRELELGALLHDVGMSCIPETLLSARGPFDAEQLLHVQEHPLLGAALVGGSELLACALPVVLHHHERYDGGGYPHRLAREAIPLAARLFAVLDAYEAMTQGRPYAAALSVSGARAQLGRASGSQLDPHAVELFLAADPDAWSDANDGPAAS
jgi:putative two-component system response regulator